MYMNLENDIYLLTISTVARRCFPSAAWTVIASRETRNLLSDRDSCPVHRVGVSDEDASVRRVARHLPEAVLEELVMSWKNAQMAVAESSPIQEKILVNPKLFHSRMQVAKAFDDYLVMNGWDKNMDGRIPRNSCPSFIESRLVVANIKSMAAFRRCLFRWHKEWRKDARQRVTGPKGQRLTVIRKKPLQSKGVHFHRRQRNNIVGRPYKCPWLRVALYEW